MASTGEIILVSVFRVCWRENVVCVEGRELTHTSLPSHRYAAISGNTKGLTPFQWFQKWYAEAVLPSGQLH